MCVPKREKTHKKVLVSRSTYIFWEHNSSAGPFSFFLYIASNPDLYPTPTSRKTSGQGSLKRRRHDLGIRRASGTSFSGGEKRSFSTWISQVGTRFLTLMSAIGGAQWRISTAETRHRAAVRRFACVCAKWLQYLHLVGPLCLAAFYFVSPLRHMAASPSSMLAWTHLVLCIIFFFFFYPSSLYADNILPPRAFMFQPRGTNSFVRVTWKSSLGGKSKDHPPHFFCAGTYDRDIFQRSARRKRLRGERCWMVFFDGRAFFRIHNLFIAISFDFLVKFKFRGTNFRDEKKSIDFTRPTRKPLLKCFFLFVTWFPPSRGKTKSSLWLTSFCSIGLPGSHSSSPLGNLIYLN